MGTAPQNIELPTLCLRPKLKYALIFLILYLLAPLLMAICEGSNQRLCDCEAPGCYRPIGAQL